MNRLFPIWLVFLCGWSLPAISSDLEDMQPGLWQTRVQVQFPNGRMPFTFTSQRCLTQADPVPNTNQGQDCHNYDLTIKDNTVSWKLQCKGEKGILEGQGKITFKGKTFSGNMDIAIKERDRSAKFVYHMQGEYQSPCPVP
ncbi:MAG: DUF3617 family protein [Gammaproteobacteria bacterium]|nr:MAG: DUF3617 family protein [Gammaproteobacteria bacterium]